MTYLRRMLRFYIRLLRDGLPKYRVLQENALFWLAVVLTIATALMPDLVQGISGVAVPLWVRMAGIAALIGYVLLRVNFERFQALQAVINAAAPRDAETYRLLVKFSDESGTLLSSGPTGPEESARFVETAKAMTAEMVSQLKPRLPPHEWEGIGTIEFGHKLYSRRDKVTVDCAEHWVVLNARRDALRALARDYAPNRIR